jgi:pimeloyl-ACP methyl ester carboxylesterase
MPQATVNGVSLTYLVLGDTGPWIALIPGGRRGHDEFLSLGEKIAAHGFRVLLHDRRNTGASDIVIAGADSEEIIWTDDLNALLQQLNATPAFISGSSSGARMAIRMALRHPASVAGLLLFRVTGGPFAAGRLPENYYGQYITAAAQGGMDAVLATPHYQACRAANPASEARLRAMDPADYIAVMSTWRDQFIADAHHPVMGASPAQLATLRVPTLVIPGNDKTHSRSSGLAAHELIPGAELYELPIEDQDVALVPFEDWAGLEDEIAGVFAGFIRRVTPG